MNSDMDFVGENCRPRRDGEASFWELGNLPERYKGIASLSHVEDQVVGRQTREPSRLTPFPRYQPGSRKASSELEFDRGVAGVDITEWVQSQLDLAAPTFSVALGGYYRDEKVNDSCASALLPESIEIRVVF